MGAKKSDETKKKLQELKDKPLEYTSNKENTNIEIKVNPRRSFDNKISLKINQL